MTYALERGTFLFLKSGSDGRGSGWDVLKIGGELLPVDSEI